MDDEMSLIEPLTLNLQQILDKQWLPEETPQVVVGGSFGEAIAASRARVMLLHEKLAALGEESVAVLSYPFEDIEAIEMTATQTGAILQIRPSSPPEDPEDAILHLPAYDAAKFEVVATKLRVLLETYRAENPPLPRQPEIPVSGVKTPEPACPTCGAAMLPGAAHCVSCGHRVRAKCEVCQIVLDLGWQYCPHCGNSTRHRAVESCPNCGHSLEFGGFIFCPYCGKRVATLCSQCRGVLHSHWQHCPNCGKEVGAIPSQGRAGLWRGASKPEDPRREPTEEEIQPQHSESRAAEEMNAQGVASYEAEKLGDAIVLFRKAIALDPDNATYHLNLAVAYGEKSMDQEALAEYHEVLRLDPQNVSAYLNMGYILNEHEDSEGASQAWKKVVSLAPGSQEAEEARQAMETIDEV
ncbi:MAG: tetratricopeptide repeat protein [Armatimonadetes bacterium]|nr:tetratricopeptide repeat protein [Armatimonadota bacterium]